jgi:hypothetical protein
MLDSLTTRNYADFKRRYQGTYGFYIKDDGSRVLVQVTSVGNITAKFMDVRGIEYSANADRDVMFDFIPINKGLFNGHSFMGSVLFLYRVPARQWQRGISDANTVLQAFNKGRWHVQELQFAWLNAMFDPTLAERDKWQVPYENYKNGKIDVVALSKHFAVSTDNVYFYNNSIGTIKDRRIIELGNPMVMQELSDMISRKGYDFKVTHNA